MNKSENIKEVYEFQRTIGEGAYGRVFIGMHLISKQLRAIKEIGKDKATLDE